MPRLQYPGAHYKSIVVQDGDCLGMVVEMFYSLSQVTKAKASLAIESGALHRKESHLHIQQTGVSPPKAVIGGLRRDLFEST